MKNVNIWLAVLFYFFSTNASAVDEQKNTRIPHEKHPGEYITGVNIKLMMDAFKKYATIVNFDPSKCRDVLNYFRFKVVNKEDYYLVIVIRNLEISDKYESSYIYGSGGEFKINKEDLEIIEYSINK